jgi:hypothetical protein
MKRIKYPTFALWNLDVGNSVEFPNEQRNSINTISQRLKRQGYGRYRINKTGDTFMVTKLSLPLSVHDLSKAYDYISEKCNRLENTGKLNVMFDDWIDDTETIHLTGEATLIWKYGKSEQSFDRDEEDKPETWEIETTYFIGTVTVYLDDCMIVKQQITL